MDKKDVEKTLDDFKVSPLPELPVILDDGRTFSSMKEAEPAIKAAKRGNLVFCWTFGIMYIGILILTILSKFVK